MTEAEAIERFRPFVYKTARRAARSDVVLLEDLMQEGLAAVAIAFRQWRKKGGANMLTWIHRPVRWAIMRAATANLVGGTTGSIRGLAGAKKSVRHVSMDAPLHFYGIEHDLTLHDLIGGPIEDQPDVLALRRLPRAMATLLPRERLAIRLRFEEEMTLEEAGARLGLGGERVRQIEAEALRKLRAALVGKARLAS